MSAKRGRSESGDSLPELEQLHESDYSDDEGLISRRRNPRFSKYDSPPSSGGSDSENEEPVDPQRSLLGDGDSVRVEPFSIPSSEESGIVDEDGNVIGGSKDSAEDRDPWLDSLDAQNSSTDDLTKARENVRVRDEYWSSIDRGSSGPDKSTEHYLFHLIERLAPGESPREAMDRCLGLRNQPRPNDSFRSTIKAKRGQKGSASEPLNVTKDAKSFEEITELCDSLVAKGLHSILEERREKLTQLLSSRSYEYRWKAQPEGQTYGPFSIHQIVAWKRQGCFEANPIVVRIADSNGPWSELDAII